MKKELLIITVVILQNFYCISQVTFENRYSYGDGETNANCIRSTSDGGYICCGTTDFVVNTSADIFLVKLNSMGDTSWIKSYNAGAIEKGFSVLEIPGSGFMICGSSTLNVGIGNQNIYIIKTDILGNVLWEKIYGSPGDDGAYNISRTNGGGFVITGWYNYVFPSADFFIMNLDTNGTIQWTKIFGTASDDEGSEIFQTPNGEFLLAGYNSQPGYDYNFCLTKTDSSGNIQWTKSYGGPGYEECWSGILTSDGGYIFVGTTDGFSFGGYDMFAVKTDSGGNILWSANYGTGNDDYAYSITQTSDNGYAIVGFSGTDVCLLKINSSGNLQWNKTYGGNAMDVGYSVNQTPDGGYIIGATWDWQYGFSGEMYIIKTDSAGNTLCSNPGAVNSNVPVAQVIAVNPSLNPQGSQATPVSLVTAGAGVATVCSSVNIPESFRDKDNSSVFPTPAQNELFFDLQETICKTIVQIYNLQGIKMLEKEINMPQGRAKLDIKNLPCGFYTAKLTCEGIVHRYKFLKTN